MTSSFWNAFMSQGWAGRPETAGDTAGRMNSAASQSSNSGWLGNSACEPKFSVVFTSPTPKNRSQARFTQTRAVSGLPGSTIHRASPRRLSGWPAGRDGKTAGRPAVTASPRLSYWPRTRMNASRGLSSSFITMALGIEPRRSASVFFAAATADSAARTGLSTLARKNFSSSVRCSGERFAGSVARIVAKAAGNAEPSSDTVLAASDVRDKRKRPMPCWPIDSCRNRTVRVAFAGAASGVSSRNIARRGRRFVGSLPSTAQPRCRLPRTVFSISQPGCE